MKNQIPVPIVNAATAMLQPFVPELSATGLVEALTHREPTPAEPTFRKPLTRREAAEILQVSVNSINRYIRSGLLKAHRVGQRLIRIDPRSLEELLQGTPVSSPEA